MLVSVPMRQSKLFLTVFACVLACAVFPAPTRAIPGVAAWVRPAERPKNVIVMIADGTGYSLLDAARYWTGKPLTVDGPGWQRLSMATYSLRLSPKPPKGLGPLDQDPRLIYDPQKHYDPTPVPGILGRGHGEEDAHGSTAGQYPRGFAGYEYHRRSFPDSANTMSAIMSGVSSYNGAINVDGDFNPTVTVPEVARRNGRRVGSITTVPFPHATPAAGGGAHNVSRGNYLELADEMLRAGVCDVIAGGGDPTRDDDGRPEDVPHYTYVSESNWRELKSGTLADRNGSRWTLVQDAAAIRDLANGPTPQKLLMVPPVGRTLQEKRTSPDRNGDGLSNELDRLHTTPDEDAMTPDLPTLSDLTRASLNALDDGPHGFFLMVEGGATDWGEHDNELGRAIEEYEGFDRAVKVVCDYLDAGTNGNTWGNTLVVVTADHDHLLMGPDAATVPFQPVVDNGPGKMPGHRWMSNSHSSLPVPIFFRGAGSDLIPPMATKRDEFDDGVHRFGRGAYFHETDLGKLLIRLTGDA